jgi:uncharacterized protein
MDVRPTGDGVRIALRVRPRSRPEVAERDGTLTIAVAAPPVDGRATHEARAALAAALGVAVSRVRLHTGSRGRAKVFDVRGLDVETATARLRAACGLTP